MRMTVLAAVLTLPVFVLEMGSHAIPAFHHWVMDTIGHQTSWLIQFALTTAVLLGPGLQFYRKGIPALLRGAPDMNSLVALGTGAAWMLLGRGDLRAAALLPAGSAHVYYEAAAVIVTLILLGRTLEARAKGRTGEAIRRLIGLQARTALVVRNGASEEVPVDAIVARRPDPPAPGRAHRGRRRGDGGRVLGRRIHADGRAAAGGQGAGRRGHGRHRQRHRRAHLPRDPGRPRHDARPDHPHGRTGAGARLPIQSLVNRITAVFVPVVIGIAALTVAVWLAFGPEPTLTHALVAGVAVLIIACPCAMGLATPTSIMVGTGRAAELGVLFRKGDALQSLHEARVVAFDKTGTLTAGRPEMVALEAAPGIRTPMRPALVAALEARSEHPIAGAVVRAARAQGLALPEPEASRPTPGSGFRARLTAMPSWSARRGCSSARASTSARCARRPRRRRRGGARRSSPPSTGTAAAFLAVADPSSPAPRRPSRRCTRSGSRSR
jgi:P-type Cu+ transporter